ncbi:MAG: hypothetical protein KC441_13005, partial [Anaerolineales bacterium]|nr:hypothetical protein [Anaerolineales bacterium]
MTDPDFTQINYAPKVESPQGPADWPAQVEAATGRPAAEWAWQTLEQIDVRPFYTQADLAGMAHLGFVSGIPPYLRGPYPTMYAERPWTVRQYAGFSTAEASNAFYRRN